MERVIWCTMHAYKELFLDKSYNDGSESVGFIMGEVIVFGCYAYADERRVSNDFIELTLANIRSHIEKNGQIRLETMCFIAASLRGDFGKHQKKIGGFFGTSARKLGFDRSVFDSHPCNVTEFHSGTINAKIKLNIPI